MTNSWIVGLKVLVINIMTYIINFAIVMLIMLSSIFSKLSGKILLAVWLVISIPAMVWVSGKLATVIWKWR